MTELGGISCLPDGYSTFDNIAEKLKEKDIVLTYDPNTLKSTIQTKHKIGLLELRKLLGFFERKELDANKTKTSPGKINVNDGLNVVTISCDVMKSERNFLMALERTFYIPYL